jgi:hypothetical protein
MVPNETTSAACLPPALRADAELSDRFADQLDLLNNNPKYGIIINGGSYDISRHGDRGTPPLL